jgi:hypothetical protein
MEMLQEELASWDKLLSRLQEDGEEVEKNGRYVHSKEATVKQDPCTMTEKSIIHSSLLCLFDFIESIKGSLGQFELHTKGIGSNLLNIVGFNGQGLGKNDKGMKKPLEVESRPHRERSWIPWWDEDGG